MSLSREEISAAEMMHRFVLQYERRRKMLPLTVCAVLPSFFMIIGNQARHRDPAAPFLVGVYAMILIFGFITQRIQAAQYRDNIVILEVLEREHSDELPWIQEKKMEAEVKKHLAAVHQIEQELAKNPAAA